MFWNLSKRNSFNCGLMGLDIVCLILKVVFLNGDFRLVKCGEVIDVKVGLFILLYI